MEYDYSGFLDYLLLEKKYSQHTVIAYKNDLKSFKAFYLSQFNSHNIHEASYNEIRNWIVSLSESGITNRTINRKVSSLNSYYKFLMKSKQVEVNPLVKHKALKTSKKVQIPFSQEEIKQVIELLSKEQTFEALRDKVIVELFYATGIRRAELINIKVNDIDFQQKTLKVLGKRNKERVIPLLPSVLETLSGYILKRNESFEAKNEFLILTNKGLKIYETFVYRIINSYFSIVSSKLKKSPHVIRHSFATHLLNQGANLNALKELLGHSSLAATQVYTHNSVEQLKKVYSKSHPRSKN